MSTELTYNPDAKKDFEALPNGIYKAYINKVEYAKSKEKQKPMIKVSFRIWEGPEGAADQSKSRKRLVFENFMLDIEWRKNCLFKMCKAAGLPEQYFKEFLDTAKETWKRLEELPVRIRLTQQKNKESQKMENKVDGENYFEWNPGPQAPANIGPAMPPSGTAQGSLPFEQ